MNTIRASESRGVFQQKVPQMKRIAEDLVGNRTYFGKIQQKVPQMKRIAEGLVGNRTYFGKIQQKVPQMKRIAEDSVGSIDNRINQLAGLLPD